MTKLIITEQQFNRLMLHEQKSRLNENSNEVLLGVAFMLGVKLSGRNKEVATNSIQDTHIMGKIKATLEDENKTKDLIKSLTEKGMKSPESTIINKLEDLVHKYGLGHKVYNNLQSLV